MTEKYPSHELSVITEGTFVTSRTESEEAIEFVTEFVVPTGSGSDVAATARVVKLGGQWRIDWKYRPEAQPTPESPRAPSGPEKPLVGEGLSIALGHAADEIARRTGRDTRR